MTQPFLACITEALDKGEIDADTAAEVRDSYDDAYQAASETLSPVEADRVASAKALSALEAQALRAKQLRVLAIRSRREVLEGIARLKTQRGYSGVQALGGRGGKPPKAGWIQGGAPPPEGPGRGGAMAARALELLVENKPGISGAPFASLAGRQRAIRGQFDAMMAEVIERFETRFGFDAPDRAVLDNVVREAFGEDTGDAAAKSLAGGWAETAELARKMFNAAGGDIGKRADWGLPQFHDPLAVRRAGKDAWVEAVVPRLNRAAMIDRATGLPFSDKRLRAVLGETWMNITTGGLAKRQPGERVGKGRLADQRGEERFLVFKGADDWLAYSQEYGAGDPFGIMMGHLEEMSRDIAALQVLGPNPAAQFDWLMRFAEREAAIELANGVKGAERAKTYLRQARNMFDHYNGAANVPENEWLAETGASVRSYLTGAMLGSSVISDVPSAPVFGAMARSFAGLSKTGDIGALLAQITSPQARANARRSGFIIEQATDGLIRGTQDSLRLMTVGGKTDGRGFNAFARRLPAAIMRLQGQTAVTSFRKRTFRSEFMGALWDRRDKTLAALKAGDNEDKAFAQLLTARGFTEADWAVIRSSDPWEPTPGARFLRPTEIIAKDQALGLRVAEMIEMETRLAAPETTLWTRAKLLGQSLPGTPSGEFRRSWSMFRSFTLTATHLYGEELFMRGARSANGPAYWTAWATGLLGVLTVAGAVAIQMRQMVQGNDPRDMSDAKFWGAAMMQGGGLGILGDFLYSSESRAGKSSAMTGWGPAAAMVSDLSDLTIGNAFDVLGSMTDRSDPLDLDEAVAKARIGRDAARFAGRYNPTSSLWWSRTLQDRAVIDQLQSLIDPEADEAFQRTRRRLERDYGQGQWWPEGQALPERAPDVTAVAGAQP